MFFKRRKRTSDIYPEERVLKDFFITDIRNNVWIEEGYSSSDALERAREEVRRNREATEDRGHLGSNNPRDYRVTRYWPVSARPA